ncbi:hypothetical protein [Palleronia pontilimi]|uniref:hypothetical protein n=1 Tax=Palleronia pontilimi TaxID=1964209 RepID=UPI001F2FE154|nr:hypothetical protein [Palleronia pontilimi]
MWDSRTGYGGVFGADHGVAAGCQAEKFVDEFDLALNTQAQVVEMSVLDRPNGFYAAEC